MNLQGVYAKDRLNKRHVRAHIDSQLEKTWAPDGTTRLHRQLKGNIVDLPEGHKVATSGPKPQIRNDLSEMIIKYQTIVSLAYGIPRPYMVQDYSMKTAGASELVSAALRQTLAMWSQRFSHILTAVMRCIYYPDDCNYLFSRFFKKEKKKDFVSEARLLELLETAKEVANVAVSLPVTPAIDVEKLWFMFQTQAVEFHEYVSHSRAMMGLGAVAISKESKEPADPQIMPQPTRTQLPGAAMQNRQPKINV